MKRTVLLYKSKYGGAKAYAAWLREELHGEAALFDLKSKAPLPLADYDTVVLLGGVYAGRIAGMNVLKKHQHALEGKRLAVFAVGASEPTPKLCEELKAANLAGLSREIPLFYGRGALDESAMHFGDRTILKMVRKAMENQKNAGNAPSESFLPPAGGSACDWKEKRYLAPLAAYVTKA